MFNFERSTIEAWHNREFEDYETSVLSGLLEGDPSFAIVMPFCSKESVNA